MILQQTHLIDGRIPAVVVAPGVLLTADGPTSLATLVTQGIEATPARGTQIIATAAELRVAKKMSDDLRVLEQQAHKVFQGGRADNPGIPGNAP